MNAPIPVLATIADACRLVLQRKNDLLRVGLVFLLGSFALNVFGLNYLRPMLGAMTTDATGQLVMDNRLPGSLLLVLITNFLLVSVFGVGWHRLILLGPERAGGGLGVQLGLRELRYFVRLWLCFIAAVAVGFFLSVIDVAMALRLGVNPYATVPVAYLGFIPIEAYFIGRLGPSFAAIAVGLPAEIGRWWQATMGNGGRLLALYLLVGLGWLAISILLEVLAGILGLGELAPYAVLFLSAFVSTALLAVLVTINALVFRRLVGTPGIA
jgi:hypothetical protein